MLATEKCVRRHFSRDGQGRGRKRRHIRSDGSCLLHLLYFIPFFRKIHTRKKNVARGVEGMLLAGFGGVRRCLTERSSGGQSLRSRR